MIAVASIMPEPVRKSITVEAPAERAFEVFTSQFGTWWPATHSIGSSPLKNAVIEPRTGGRWYEVGEDGSECEWGEVIAWEKPTRLVLAWRIGVDWRYDPNLLTEVEVRFTQVAENATQVELEHRLLETMGDKAAAARESFSSPGGWPGLLAAYAEKVGESNPSATMTGGG
ncbi:ATPase [Sinorhizobium medicae]|nr:ATPase [Sinorhizobium medicae]MDX0544100.1 ATPase [Sinorhizobium medicae]MDX0876780.1 ATPase [Sinorhizobium medicae]MDX0953068.1 ATPase [Sinorhizobium medicae]MDX1066093.1 ATPase [Sinorhizobium medicae]